MAPHQVSCGAARVQVPGADGSTTTLGLAEVPPREGADLRAAFSTQDGSL